jgi:Transcriptional regulator
MQDYAPEELVQHTVLAREKGSTTRILLDRFLDRIEGYGTPRIVEMDSNETIKEGVIAGLGVAMLSLHVVEREMRQALLHQLAWPGLPIMRYWYLVVPDGPKILESTHRIEEAIRALNGSFLPPQMRPA